MSDPLKLLRDFNIKKKDIVEEDDKIVFGDSAWPKNFKTKYEIKLKGNVDKEYYTLECINFFLKNKDVVHPEYCKLAADASIPAVRRPDRKDLLAYLNGDTDSFGSKPNAVQQGSGRKRPAQGNQSYSKKKRKNSFR